ncbi:MAG: 1-acyl-sn-glycerol-3-phosphate acyltransferase [Oscillospiraceae bacterium]|nr:1-acyl-sn-glycerol-3-phosphate acyltransferase [Oscillospiraceae bacterium]
MNAFVRYTVRGVYHLWYDFKIEGEENVPEQEGFIIACNHRSLADPVLVTMPVRKPVKYMAKEELFKSPIFAAFIRGLGAFPIRRGAGDMGVIDDCVERLRKGYNVVIFPEGTRQYENKVARLKTGVAVIAGKSGAPVLPMGVVFEGKKLHFRSKLTLRIGKPIPPEEIAVPDGDRHALNACKARIAEALKELVEGAPDAVSDDSTDKADKGTDE